MRVQRKSGAALLELRPLSRSYSHGFANRSLQSSSWLGYGSGWRARVLVLFQVRVRVRVRVRWRNAKGMAAGTGRGLMFVNS